MEKTKYKQLSMPFEGMPIEVEIAEEWDLNAQERAKELELKLDTTYFSDIVPLFREKISEYGQGKRIIDVGCGLGYLTNEVLDLAGEIIGIDISRRSISYASRKFPNIEFIHSSINQIANAREQIGDFDICTSNMVFHNCVDLDKNINSIKSFLKNDGLLIVTIPHPCFWYRKHPEIRYVCKCKEEKIYKVKFKVKSGRKHPSVITYVQRNLTDYYKAFNKNSFKVIDFIEMNDNSDCEPGILAYVCKKI